MIELLTNSEMAKADRLAVAGGVRGFDLMQKAGRAVADVILAEYPQARRVVVVAGPGNNGGDGFVAAQCLAASGRDVRVLFVGAPAKLRGNAAEAAQVWRGPTEDATPEKLAATETDLVVDALFGVGLDRAVENLPRAMIEAMNDIRAPIVAVDLPSGIDGTSGAVLGAAVKAARTVTFFRRKAGHVLLPGRLHCGRITVADIGLPESVLAAIKPKTFLNDPALWSSGFPVPRPRDHKYTRGHAVVVSGPMQRTGAARLAARGALRAGAGLVTVASRRDALPVHAAANLAVMVQAVDDAAELTAFLQDPRLNAVVLGPGGGVGPALRDMVLAALAGPRSVVLDADALTSFAETPEALVSAVKGRGAPTILTPHEGEFSRLFKALLEKAKVKQKLEVTRLASHETGAILLLKGADSVVAAPDGRAAIAANAPPWLATAGTGDVLAGFVAGLVAQGMPGFEAAAAAVWLHGETAATFGPGLISEDLPEALPAVYRRLFEQLSADPAA